MCCLSRSVLDQAQVRKHLEGVLASPEFARSERMCRFLRFVVERTLDGEVDFLKESVIGVQVFDRNIGYDPKTDAIVRVEARRLRGKLLEYETQFGHTSTISITLPKGGYIPDIEIRETPAVAEEIRPAQVTRDRVSRRSLLTMSGAIGASALIGLWISRSKGTAGGLVQSRPFTTWPGYETTPAFSPDGLTIAFASGAIYLQRIDSENAVKLTNGPASDVCPRFSPDGKRIAFARAQEKGVGIYTISIDGKNERKIVECQDAPALSRIDWSPDGRYVVFRENDHGRSRLAMVAVGSGVRQWIPVEGPSELGEWWPAFSPRVATGVPAGVSAEHQ